MDVKLTFDLLPAVSVLFVLAAALIPKFKDWFGDLESANKQQLMAVGLLGVTVGAAVLSYFGFVDIYHGANWQEWVWYPVVDFVIALIANASTYKATNYMIGPQN